MALVVLVRLAGTYSYRPDLAAHEASTRWFDGQQSLSGVDWVAIVLSS